MKSLLLFILLLTTAFICSFSIPSGLATDFTPNQAKLIYEFIIQFKHIRRLTLLTCHQLNSFRPSDDGLLNQTTSGQARISLIDNLTLTKSLFKTAGILIKVLVIDKIRNWDKPRTTRSPTATDNVVDDWTTFLRAEDQRQVVVLNLSCGNNSLEILKRASERRLFNSSYHWLLIDEGLCFNRCSKDQAVRTEAATKTSERVECEDGRFFLIEFLSKLNININTELMLASKRIDKDYYSLFDIWNPGRQYGGKLNITRVGRFTIPGNCLQMYDWFKRTTTIVRRMDMKNALIRCMIVITNNITKNIDDYLNDQHNPHLDSMHRFNFALLSHVKDMFNFRFRLYRTDSWGYRKNGTFDGMIGALVRQEVDIGGSPIFFRRERAEVIDYTSRTWIARPCFIFRHPSTSFLSRNIFLQPFTNSVWWSIGACGLSVTILLWNLRRTEKNLLLNAAGTGNGIAHTHHETNKTIVSQHRRNWEMENNRHNGFRKTDTTSSTTAWLMANRASVASRINRYNHNLEDLQARGLNCPHKSQLSILPRGSRQHQQRGVRQLPQKPRSERRRQYIGGFDWCKNIATRISSLTTRDVPTSQTYYRNFLNNSNMDYYRSRRPGPHHHHSRLDFRLFETHRSPSVIHPHPDRWLDAPRTCPRRLESKANHSKLQRNYMLEKRYKKLFLMPDKKNVSILDIHGNRDMRRALKLNCLPNNGNGNGYLSLSYFKESVDAMPSRSSGSLLNCIIFFLGALCQQGPQYSCHLLSSRTVILSTLLFTFCISQFYSGTIVGTLLMERPKTIRTIRDLIDSPLKILVEDIVYNRDYFQRTTDPDAIELYRKKISQPVVDDEVVLASSLQPSPKDSTNGISGARSIFEAGGNRWSFHESNNENRANASNRVGMKKGVSKQSWKSAVEGVRLMKTGGYAFHVDVATAYNMIWKTFTEREICELTEIQLFPPQKMVGVVQKGSPLRKIITYGLRRTIESGLMDRQRKFWHSPKPRCCRRIQSTDLRVGMETVSSALFVLIVGLVSSVTILTLEVTYDLWHRKMRSA